MTVELILLITLATKSTGKCFFMRRLACSADLRIFFGAVLCIIALYCVRTRIFFKRSRWTLIQGGGLGGSRKLAAAVMGVVPCFSFVFPFVFLCFSFVFPFFFFCFSICFPFVFLLVAAVIGLVPPHCRALPAVCRRQSCAVAAKAAPEQRENKRKTREKQREIKGKNKGKTKEKQHAQPP